MTEGAAVEKRQVQGSQGQGRAAPGSINLDFRPTAEFTGETLANLQPLPLLTSVSFSVKQGQ